MKIFEIAGMQTPSPNELLGLVQFLRGRAADTNAQQTISKGAFIQLAQDMDINLTMDNLAEVVGQPPLSSVLKPVNPDSPDLEFLVPGQPEAPTAMPVNKAQDIVAKAAKSAMNRDRSL